jgi:peptidoglycan/LPS O-acetylase OafA/YrhL
MKLTNKLAHYGDILAIPFFVITLYYFYQIDNKSWLEVIVTMFLIIGLLCDILFTYIFLQS